MVSVMTFDDLTATYARHVSAEGLDEVEARERLLDWLDTPDGEEPVVSREVGIVLASADFSQEVTTTVLWLNEFYGMDIRCVRLSPYKAPWPAAPRRAAGDPPSRGRGGSPSV
nr:hypothetical protein [Angustibacter aerolatus]